MAPFLMFGSSTQHPGLLLHVLSPPEGGASGGTPDRGIVPQYDPQSGRNFLLQIAEDRVQTPAVRALIVAVLDQRILSTLWTENMVEGTIRKQKRARSAESIRPVATQLEMYETPGRLQPRCCRHDWGETGGTRGTPTSMVG